MSIPTIAGTFLPLDLRVQVDLPHAEGSYNGTLILELTALLIRRDQLPNLPINGLLGKNLRRYKAWLRGGGTVPDGKSWKLRFANSSGYRARES